jgi:hypothetical protein
MQKPIDMIGQGLAWGIVASPIVALIILTIILIKGNL